MGKRQGREEEKTLHIDSLPKEEKNATQENQRQINTENRKFCEMGQSCRTFLAEGQRVKERIRKREIDLK